MNSHRALERRPATLVELLENLDAFRRPDRFEAFVFACEADARGRKGLENRDYPPANFLRAARKTAASVSLTEAEREGLTGEQIAERIRQRRIEAISSLKGEQQDGSSLSQG